MCWTRTALVGVKGGKGSVPFPSSLLPSSRRLCEVGGPSEGESLDTWRARQRQQEDKRAAAPERASSTEERNAESSFRAQLASFAELDELTRTNRENLEGVKQLFRKPNADRFLPGIDLPDADKLRELDRLLALAKALGEVAVRADTICSDALMVEATTRADELGRVSEHELSRVSEQHRLVKWCRFSDLGCSFVGIPRGRNERSLTATACRVANCPMLFMRHGTVETRGGRGHAARGAELALGPEGILRHRQDRSVQRVPRCQRRRQRIGSFKQDRWLEHGERRAALMCVDSCSKLFLFILLHVHP